MTDPEMDEFRPTKFHLSNAEVNATGILCGGAVANIARELIQLREVVYGQMPSAYDAHLKQSSDVQPYVYPEPRKMGADGHGDDCPFAAWKLFSHEGIAPTCNCAARKE